MPVSVLTQHNDNGRSGANLNEPILTAANVNLNQFGKLFTHDVSGFIYAQPLYVPRVHIVAGGIDKGIHNIVIVATMNNWIYAFDADNAAGGNANPLWGHQLQNKPPIPSTIYRRGYQDIIGNMGILSTPVIDAQIDTTGAKLTIGTIYILVNTYDPKLIDAQPQKAFQKLLFALDLRDGQPVTLPGGQANPGIVIGSVPGAGYLNAADPNIRGKIVNKEIVVNGQINGKQLPIKDGSQQGSVQQVEFNPMQQLQRPALLLVDGLLYVAFGSIGDFDPYHGWVLAYEARTLTQKGVFCTTPNGAEAGVWQAGEGPVADTAGNIYVGTGNGDFAVAPGRAPNLGECFVKLLFDGARLELTGLLQAFKDSILDPLNKDQDLGASSPTLLPDGQLVGGGKDGKFYLLDPSKLDVSEGQAALVQKFNASFDPKSIPSLKADLNNHHIHGSPVVFDSPEHGPLVYVWGENDALRAYSYDSVSHEFPGQPGPTGGQGVPTAMGTTIASRDRADHFGMPGAMLSVSANGKTPGSGIVWASFPPYDSANQQTVLGELRAYDASRFDDQGRLVTLWSSRFNPNRDHYGNFPKFCCPTIANGKVYQATFNTPGQLVVYGLVPTPNGGYNLGFGGNTGLTFNGTARVDHGHVRLTEVPHLFQAASVFSTHPVNVKRFQTVFRIQVTPASPANIADGFTFTLQGEGPHALGGWGGGLGYGPDSVSPNDRGYRITSSLAVKFGLFDGHQNVSLTGLYLNGATPQGGPSETPAGVDLHGGHPIRVTLDYDGTTLTVVILDETTRQQATHSYPVNIIATIGAMAHVGFTAGTGGLAARQDILSWQFTS
jgi:Legume lectin domain